MAINLFQVDLDKPWNCLWYCYEKQWSWRRGCKDCKRTPKSFDLLKIWTKAQRIRVKIAPNVVWLKKMAPKVCIKKTWRPFFGGCTKKRSSRSLWDKICSQKLHKKFSGKFGEIRAKSFAPQTFACSYAYDEKAPPPPLPLFDWAEGEMPSPCLHSPASLCILFYTHSLYSLL